MYIRTYIGLEQLSGANPAFVDVPVQCSVWLCAYNFQTHRYAPPEARKSQKWPYVILPHMMSLCVQLFH